jgi:hypothetical protein
MAVKDAAAVWADGGRCANYRSFSPASTAARSARYEIADGNMLRRDDDLGGESREEEEQASASERGADSPCECSLTSDPVLDWLAKNLLPGRDIAKRPFQPSNRVQ